MLYHIHLNEGGWRFAVLFHKGRKEAKLLITSTFEIQKIPVRTLDTLTPVRGKKTAAELIRNRRALYKNNGLKVPGKAVKLALRALT